MSVSYSIVRKSLDSQIREKLDSLGIGYKTDRSTDRILYLVKGQLLTPGEVADIYLPESSWSKH